MITGGFSICQGLRAYLKSWKAEIGIFEGAGPDSSDCGRIVLPPAGYVTSLQR
jgi:hypothetical protein